MRRWITSRDSWSRSSSWTLRTPAGWRREAGADAPTPSLTGVGKGLQVVLTRRAMSGDSSWDRGRQRHDPRKEITVLRLARYKTLGIKKGLPNSSLDQFLLHLQSESSRAQVDRPTGTCRFPGRPSRPRPGCEGAIRLDEDLLRKNPGETHEVACMLGGGHASPSSVPEPSAEPGGRGRAPLIKTFLRHPRLRRPRTIKKRGSILELPRRSGRVAPAPPAGSRLG